MIQAYRRGLLKPDYPNGLRSKLRENVLLDTLDMDSVFELATTRMQLMASILGPAIVDGNARKRLLKNLGQDLRYFDMVRNLAFDEAEQYKYENSELALVKAYEILKAQGFMELDEPAPETE
jgi:hypothetical protein